MPVKCFVSAQEMSVISIFLSALTKCLLHGTQSSEVEWGLGAVENLLILYSHRYSSWERR